MKKYFDNILGYFKELGKLTPMALVTAFLPILGSATLLIVAHPLGNWLRENWEIGTLWYFLGVVFFCGLALLPTNVVGIIGGWAFGFELGILVLIAAVVGAATVSFTIHSRIVGDRLPHVFDARPKARAIYEALVSEKSWRTFAIISLLRLTPAMPFALTNFLMASARVPLGAFVAGTFVGMLPRSSAMVLVGAGLSELSFDNTQNKWLIIFGIAVTIITVIVIGAISKRALERTVQNAKCKVQSAKR